MFITINFSSFIQDIQRPLVFGKMVHLMALLVLVLLDLSLPLKSK